MLSAYFLFSYFIVILSLLLLDIGELMNILYKQILYQKTEVFFFFFVSFRSKIPLIHQYLKSHLSVTKDNENLSLKSCDNLRIKGYFFFFHQTFYFKLIYTCDNNFLYINDNIADLFSLNWYEKKTKPSSRIQGWLIDFML